MTPDELSRKFVGMQRDAPKIAREQAVQASQRAVATVSAPNMAGYTIPTLKGSKAVFRPVVGSKVDAKATRAVKKQLRDSIEHETKAVSQDIAKRMTS